MPVSLEMAGEITMVKIVNDSVELNSFPKYRISGARFEQNRFNISLRMILH